MNFKNHFELYKALIEGKTIVSEIGTLVWLSGGSLIIKDDNGERDRGGWFFNYPEEWKIYEEPETWFRVTYLLNDSGRPYTNDSLYKSKDDFLSYDGGKEEDFQWIHLEEFKR